MAKFAKIIQENNENFAVINKPAGIAVQGGTKSKRNILDILKDTDEFKYSSPFAVHRIDKETTGILIVAKNRKHAQLFTTLFRIRKIHKIYLGIVVGTLKENKGTFVDELFYYEKNKKIKAKAITHYRVLDVNNQSALYYENPKRFLYLLTTQRLLRRLDEVHLLDSSANIIMSNIVDSSINFVPPSEEAFAISLNGKPVRISDPNTNRTSALVKLDNFIDTYLYIVKFMDPKLINYLNKTGEAVSYYYSVQENKTGIKITFAIIYLLIVSLYFSFQLLFQ